MAVSAHSTATARGAPFRLAPLAAVNALDAAVEDLAEDDPDPGATIQRALGPVGCGFVVLPRAIPDDVFDAVRSGTHAPAAEEAQPIINSQLHARMIELGEAADRGRRQVPVTSESGDFEAAVQSTLESVAARVSASLGATSDGVTPHIVITMPRAPAQLPHTDAGLHVEEGPSTTLLSIYVSVEEGMGVEVWSMVFGAAAEGGECTTLPTPVWVDIPLGSCLVVRSDLVHRGTSNLRGRQQLRCLHAYLAVPKNGAHSAYADHMSFPSCYF